MRTHEIKIQHLPFGGKRKLCARMPRHGLFLSPAGTQCSGRKQKARTASALRFLLKDIMLGGSQPKAIETLQGQALFDKTNQFGIEFQKAVSEILGRCAAQWGTN